jgi:methionyl-tRNA formyltransferase
MKLVFMGTSDFAVPALKLLHESKHKILRVFTKPPSKANRGQKLHKSSVHGSAEELGLDVSFPTSLKNPETIKELESLNADIIIVVSYGHILRKNVLEMCKNGCLNIHPSSLPRWRGAAPIERTVLNGDRSTSLCIIKMDAGLDTGDIIFSKDAVVQRNETSKTLSEKMAKLGAECIVEALDNFKDLTPQKQLEEGVRYAEKISKDEAIINWHDDAEKIDRMIRAFNPWPYCNFLFKGERVKLIEAESILTQEHGSKPGTVLDNRMTIACGKGTISPLILQKPGKKPVNIKDFLNGAKIKPGEVLKYDI